MLLVALAVGIGLFVVDVRDFANRKRPLKGAGAALRR